MNTYDTLAISKGMLPYECNMLLAGEVFELHFAYNAAAEVFTVDLYKGGELLCAGEPMVYGVPLWHDVYRAGLYPAVDIVPIDPSGQSDAVTYDNLGVTVLLVIDGGGT